MSNNNDNKPREENDSLGVRGINQPDVTTRNLSHSDEASTSTPIIDRITEVNQTPYYVDESDEETIRFLIDCADRGEKRGKQPSPSICKVSRLLRDDNEIFFTPQVVSIGPIHREDPKLKEFEWLKECYLSDLLSRRDDIYSTLPKEAILEACLQTVKTETSKIRESYAGMIKNYDDVELARMMVMDGCFILELCFKLITEKRLPLPNKMQNLRIAMDLILLENQVPFFVLQALFDCLAPYIMLFCVLPGKNSILCNLLIKNLTPIKLFFSRSPLTTDVDSDSTHDHVLGYLHNRFKLVAAKSLKPKLAEASQLVDEEQAKSSNPKHAETSKKPPFLLNAPSPKKLCSSFCKIFRKCSWSASKHVDEGQIVHTAFHSIVELHRAGMNFKPHQKDDWSMTFKFQSSPFACLPWFWSKPTLLMPTLFIDDTTELILRNFIAYEQSFPQDHYYFTSYAHAMDKLIDSPEDIAKLVESEVLVNHLSNQEAADMIDKISKNIFFTDFYYTDEFKRMDTYYNGYWPNTIAWVRRVYFFDSWKPIAVYYSIIVFFLTVVQTYYTIKGK